MTGGSNGALHQQARTVMRSDVPRVLLLHRQRHEQISDVVKREHGHARAAFDTRRRSQRPGPASSRIGGRDAQHRGVDVDGAARLVVGADVRREAQRVLRHRPATARRPKGVPQREREAHRVPRGERRIGSRAGPAGSVHDGGAELTTEVVARFATGEDPVDAECAFDPRDVLGRIVRGRRIVGHTGERLRHQVLVGDHIEHPAAAQDTADRHRGGVEARVLLERSDRRMAPHGRAHEVHRARPAYEGADVHRQVTGRLDRRADVVAVDRIRRGRPRVPLCDHRFPQTGRHRVDGEHRAVPPEAVGVHRKLAVPARRHLDGERRMVVHALQHPGQPLRGGQGWERRIRDRVARQGVVALGRTVVGSGARWRGDSECQCRRERGQHRHGCPSAFNT